MNNELKNKVYGYKEYKGNKEPGFYRVKRDVVVRVVKNKLFAGVVRIDDVPVDIEEGISEIYLPKIPANVIRDLHHFFRYVYNKHRAEAVILLWHHFKNNKWYIEVPKQTVSSGSCDYERDEGVSIKLESGGFTLVGSIHSHGSMSAFHSGTDDKDEFKFDGLHITFGKVTEPVPEFACRFVLKDLYLKREAADVLELPPEENDFPKDWMNSITEKKYTTYVSNQLTANRKLNSWWDDDKDSPKTYGDMWI